MMPGGVGSGLTTTLTRQQPQQQQRGAKGGIGMPASTCKPQLVPSSPAKAAEADGDLTDSEALRRASQVRMELACES